MRKSLLLGLALIAVSAKAEPADQLKLSMPQVGNWQVNDPVGAWPFISAGLGYADHNDSVRTEGMPTSIKILGSYYFENRMFVTDLGVGLFNHIVTQDGAGGNSILNSNIDLAARYRFGRGWQAGPLWTTMIGSDRYNSVNGFNTSFVGAQLLKEMTYKNEYLVRIGGRFMTDVDVPNDRVNMAMFEVAVGFIPERSGDNLTASERRQMEPVAAKGRQIPLSSAEGPVRVALFDLSRSAIATSALIRIENLAEALRRNPGLVAQIEVIGHADPTGPDRLNEKLAQQRAENVAALLTKKGLAANSLKITSKGASEPVNQSYELDELSMSRRVELRFKGVKDQAKLAEILRPIL